MRKQKPESVDVHFIKQDSPFMPGDVKSCTPAEAEKFIRQGVAELAEDVRFDERETE